jgi:hypothetical protein
VSAVPTVDPLRVDACAFRRLITEARAAVAGGRPKQQARDHNRTGLRLRRDPLAGMASPVKTADHLSSYRHAWTPVWCEYNYSTQANYLAAQLAAQSVLAN